VVYLLVSWLLKSEELTNFVNLIRRFFVSKKVGSVPFKETELVSGPPTDSSSS